MSRYKSKSKGRIEAGRLLQAMLKKSKKLREKRIRAIEAAYKRPEYKTKLSKAQRKRFLKKEERRKLRKALKRFWTKEQRAKASAKFKQLYAERPEIKEKIDAGVTEWWGDHSEVKIVYAIRATLQLLSAPEHYKKFLAGGKNKEEKQIPTLQGFVVRSEGEKEIAEFLYWKKIKTEYETVTFYLDGWICTPDFFLPKYKVIIEFYGGFPGSRKKKIIKNKLYKKYKIPFIAITPSELRNLDYYLLGEIKKLRARAKKFKLSKFLRPTLTATELKRFLYIISTHNIKLPKKTLSHIESLKKKYKIA